MKTKAKKGGKPVKKSKAQVAAQKLPFPNVIGHLLAFARYGHEFANPLVWDISSAASILRPPEGEAVPPNAVEKLFRTYFADVDSGREMPGFWRHFFERCGTAVATGDAEFFREIGDRLESNRRGEVHSRALEFIAWALDDLRRDFGPSVEPHAPTKMEVRERASELWAWSLVAERHQDANGMVFHPSALRQLANSGDGSEELVGVSKAQLRREFKTAKDCLPTQDWWSHWKKAGLSHLPGNAGGKPTHRAR